MAHTHWKSVRDMRTGALGALLERVPAEIRPERFERLLEVCLCDFAAYPGHGRRTTRKLHGGAAR